MNHDIFISYSREDKDSVIPLITRINEEVGTQCWVDLEGVESGEQFEEKIMQTIDSSKIVLFLLSDHSLKSSWTKREIYYAEKQKKKIIPVVVDGNGLRGWFQFHFGSMDFIDIQSKEQCNKLIRDLKKWLGDNQDYVRSHDNGNLVILPSNKPGIKKNVWIAIGAVVAISIVLFMLFRNKEKIDKNNVFSVSANQKVEFSKGNLQYRASDKTWQFAEHQWDYIGTDNKNISSNYDGWVDLFGWGTGNNPVQISDDDSDYGTFRDWGNNMIVNGNEKKWRTLTKDEWVYLIEKRNTISNIRYAKISLSGINGVVILPDNWNTIIYELKNVNNNKADFNSNFITQSDWTKLLESNGAIFLPAAGSRTVGNKTHDRNINYEGAYWSSTRHDSKREQAYDFYFRGNILLPDDNYYRHGGRSVRLVSDIK